MQHPSLSKPIGIALDGGQWTAVKLDGPDERTPWLQIIASDGGGWDHVSVCVSPRSRMVRSTPSWNDMEAVRRAFFFDSETVVQLSPPRSDYVNVHPGVLHLWRKQDAEHPLPPLIYV